LNNRRNPFVAREGIPFLALVVVAIMAAWQLDKIVYSVPLLMLFGWLILVFRDPIRAVPAAPLGVVSPVDGVVIETSLTDSGALEGEAHRIVIRVNSLGTYTARCPAEGKIMDLSVAVPDSAAIGSASGLWVQTDEGNDVILQFRGHRFGLAPAAFLGYGERVGQGQRCAYLRLTRFAEVQLPINSRVQVEVGQKVAAGVDVLAKLPHP
jgi:phosphatidylserine decarboxylase